MHTLGSSPVARHPEVSFRNSILLVDDSAAIRRGLRREFERAGWEVCGEAANGREAIIKAEQLLPQVILLDLAMPEMNGLTAARLLKRILPGVQLILFTAHGDLFKSDEATSAGNFCRVFQERTDYRSTGQSEEPGQPSRCGWHL